MAAPAPTSAAVVVAVEGEGAVRLHDIQITVLLL